MSDLLETADNAAFDTVDYGILCRRLQVTFGLDGYHCSSAVPTTTVGAEDWAGRHYSDNNLASCGPIRTAVCRCLFCCYASLQLRSIRRSLPSSVYQTLVVALVLTKLDYGNATLAGLPQPTCSIVFNPSSTLQLGRSLVYAARSISPILLQVFTGFMRPSVSNSNWRTLSTEPSTALHIDIGTCLNTSSAPCYLSRCSSLTPVTGRSQLCSAE